MPNYVSNVITFNATDKQLQEIYETIKADNGELGSFDFNKLVPMPESLNLTKGSITNPSIGAFLSHLKSELEQHPNEPSVVEEAKRYLDAAAQMKQNFFFGFFPPEIMKPDAIEEEAKRNHMSADDFIALGRKYLDNQIQYGVPTWYEFCNQFWGTKWNASEGILMDEEDPHMMYFETAWSAPIPIVEALSKRFPDIEVSIQWADEDIGNNVGTMSFRNGEITDEYIPEGGSKEAYELAFEIRGDTAEDLCLRYDEEEGTYVFDEEREGMLEDRIQEARQRQQQEQPNLTGTQEKEPDR